jgi:hypothetical protein
MKAGLYCSATSDHYDRQCLSNVSPSDDLCSMCLCYVPLHVRIPLLHLAPQPQFIATILHLVPPLSLLSIRPETVHKHSPLTPKKGELPGVHDLHRTVTGR